MRTWVSAELAEQVVETELRTREARGEPQFPLRYRARADALYDAHPPNERQGAFEKLHGDFFEKLGFSARVRGAVEETPGLAGRVEGIFLFAASAPHEEGVELAREAPRLGLRLRPERFADPEGLGRFLRRVLARAALLLEEVFAYRPEEDPGRVVPRPPGPVLGRYEALWEVAVAARLGGEGRAEPGTWEAAFESFSAWFGAPGGKGRDLSRRVGEVAGGLAHPEMVRFAHAPAALWERLGERGGGEGAGPSGRGRLPGERCPLCQFPTQAWAELGGEGEEEVIAAIREEFPGWTPEEGVVKPALREEEETRWS